MCSGKTRIVGILCYFWIEIIEMLAIWCVLIYNLNNEQNWSTDRAQLR
jgi:hypothetical protein